MPKAAPHTPRKTGRRITGSVTLRPSGRFMVRVTGPDGQRSSLGTFATEGEAEQALAEQMTDSKRGQWVAPQLGAEILTAYATRYLDRREAAGDLAPRTLALYRYQINHWLDATVALPGDGGRSLVLGNVALSKLTVSMIADWHAGVVAAAAATVEAAAKRKQKPPAPVQAARAWARAQGYTVATSGRLSPNILAAWHEAGAPAPKPEVLVVPAGRREAGRSAAATAYAFVRLVLGAARREGLIVANPADVPGAGTVRTPRRKPATAEQVAACAAAMEPRYAAAVIVAAWGALRGGEVFALERRHVTIHHDPFGEVDGAVLQIEQAIEEVTGHPLGLGPVKTEGSNREVHLPAYAAKALAEHLDTHTGPQPTAPVFTTTTGGWVPASRRQEAWSRARKAGGRPDLRFHDLRHTGATLAAMTGASTRELMDRLGHSTPRAALIYQHSTSDADARIAAKLNAFAPTS